MKNYQLQQSKQLTHYCLRYLLIFAQILGTFPVSNIHKIDPNQIYFKWRTFKVFYTILLAVIYLFFSCLSLYRATTHGIFISQMISPLYYFHAFVTAVSFLQLSMKWPIFIKNLTRLELQILTKYQCNLNLNRKINAIALLLVLTALFEHELAALNHRYSQRCQNAHLGWDSFLQEQFSSSKYHFYIDAMFNIISWYAAFIWNFGDIFIVLISILITTRFKQIIGKIRNYCANVEHVEEEEPGVNFIKVYHKRNIKYETIFWREIREDYNKLSQIVRHLDQLLSNLVIFSYALNLTFILIQLFNSLRQMKTVIEGIYFYYSFVLVIGRIAIVSIYGASINEASKESLPLLHSLPTNLYNEEMQRLITQIYLDTVALTGYNFFRITKGLILSVAAAIITYELVLVQFNQATLDKYMADNGSFCL